MIEKEIQKYLAEKGFKKMSLKAVLFDMDGVLFDSMKNHAKAWHEAMKIYGFDLPQPEAYLHEGRTGAGTINIVSQRQRGYDATEEEIQRIYKTKSDLFNSLPTAEPMPGADTLLKQLQDNGIIRVLVTGSGQKTLLERLNKHYPNAFTQERMVTAFDVTYGKPNPEPYLMGLKKSGCQPNEVVVVENAPLGVRAAVAAGLFTIAVNTGPLDDHYLLDEGANILFHSMQELSDNWQKVQDELQQ